LLCWLTFHEFFAAKEGYKTVDLLSCILRKTARAGFVQIVALEKDSFVTIDSIELSLF